MRLNVKDRTKVSQVVKANKHQAFSCNGCKGTVEPGAIVYQIIHTKKKRVLAKLCSQRCVDAVMEAT